MLKGRSKNRILNVDAHSVSVGDGKWDDSGIYQPGAGDRAAAVAPNDKPVAEAAPDDGADKSYKSDESYNVTGGGAKPAMVVSAAGGEAKPAAGSKVDESREVKKPTYEELFRATNPAPRDPAEDEKLLRRQRNRVLISGIGDGISAMSNLFFTSKYAPNVEQPARLSEGVQKRWDDMMARYNRERDAYNAGLRRAQDKDTESERWDRQWRLQLEGLRNKKAAADATDAARKAELERKKARDAQDQRNKEADLAEKKRHNKESEKLGRHRISVSGGGKYSINFLGKEYKNEAEYKAAVQRYVKDNPYTEQTSTDGKTTSNNGGINPKKERRSNNGDKEEVFKSIDELAGEAEAHYARKKAEEAEMRAPHRVKADAAKKEAAPYVK